MTQSLCSVTPPVCKGEALLLILSCFRDLTKQKRRLAAKLSGLSLGHILAGCDDRLDS